MKIKDEILKKALHALDTPKTYMDLYNDLSFSYAESQRIMEFLQMNDYIKYASEPGKTGYTITPVGISFRNDLDLV